jgi:hypothetical protein
MGNVLGGFRGSYLLPGEARMNLTRTSWGLVALVWLAAAVPAIAEQRYDFNFAFGETCS